MKKINYTFKNILGSSSNTEVINFNSVFKRLPQKGNLVYEYNPFRNYRLTENKYFFNDKFYSESELIDLENIISNIFKVNSDTNKFAVYQVDPDNLLKLNYMYFNNIGSTDKFVCFPLYSEDTKNYTYNLSDIINSSYDSVFKFVPNGGNAIMFGMKIVDGKNKDKWIVISADGSTVSYSSTPKYLYQSVSSENLNYPTTFKTLYNQDVTFSFNNNAKSYYLNTFGSLSKLENDSIDLYSAGSCVDFITDELQFDMEHPVDIIPLYSYDGSVNLFLNDGNSSPKLINSRFSATGKNTYEIVDRKGDNDTNIYNQGATFLSDISLHKTASTIAKIDYLGTFGGGQLPCGNYNFYFTYSDADGNETDFFAETGIISMFVGNSVESLREGLRNESSGKGIELKLSNLDAHYCYLNVYYSRATGDANLNSEKIIMKLNDKIFFSNTKFTVSITGYEATTQITESDINPVYSYVLNANTLCFSLNILFLGNVSKAKIDYTELEDISLHFVPYLDTSKKYSLDGSRTYKYNSNSYQNSKFIYKFTGYWPDEIYRIGIVYILNDTSLSSVFNIRGMYNIHEYYNGEFTTFDYYDSEGNRLYIEVDLNTSLLTAGKHNLFENSKGVVHFVSETNGETNAQIYGINIRVDNTDIFDYLKKNTKGFFFVRLRRLPTTLCQGQSICVDTCNHHPTVYDGNLGKEVEEGFLSTQTRYLIHDFAQHKHEATAVASYGMICPDYDVNSPYLNNIFNGLEFTLVKSDFLPADFKSQDRHFWNSSFISDSTRSVKDSIKIIGIEDSTPLVSAGDNLFSTVAGISSMGYKFDYINVENLTTESTNFIRGIWGPFLGLSSTVDKRTLYDIKIPNYDKSNMLSYFKIRMLDKSAYYAISDRIDINDVSENLGTFYRGDCYICKFTHRMNRNFNDDTAPYNSTIVNKKTWLGLNNGAEIGKEDERSFKVEDGVINKTNFEYINIGDINGVGLGMWVNLCVRSSINLNIRAIDESDTDLVAKTGHPKAFYPYSPVSIDGSFKHPESFIYNKGYETSVSTRYNFEELDIPAVKDDFTNRVMYSNLSISDAYVNGNRVFKANNFQDYPLLYGALVKLVPYNNAIIAVFEHGIILLQVNERALINEDGNVYISSNKVISKEPARVLSDTFGSLWKDSIIKTPYGLYGVDTVARKIWKTDGSTIECISDFKIQKYLNDNISLTERELTPIIGIRNVKSHYNKFKNDVMFTFYDNLNSVYEKAWNLCYNENMQKFVTFYSWIPSFSENIYNLYFSFDRQTSKWMSRIGQCSDYSSYKGDVSLSSVIIPNNLKSGKENWFAKLNFNFDYDSILSVELIHDNLLNFKNFGITTSVDKEGTVQYLLYMKSDVSELFAELFLRINPSTGKVCDNFTSDLKNSWALAIKNGNPWSIYKNSEGLRMRLDADDNDKRINPDNIVYYLNLKITYVRNNLTKTIERLIYFLPKYNMQFLTTDFWKHGYAGIIDITDKIYPTYWYGKQHPFEFEFVVNKAQTSHKIFDNLIIISNNAEPESFHFEIVGDSYDFAEDKPAMYFRQEASEAFYQYHGFDTEYDTDFDDIKDDVKQRHIYKFGVNDNGEESKIDTTNKYADYVKSTVFPLYYSRKNGYDEIEDYYKQSTAENKNYEGKSGTELTYDKTLNEYHLWAHSKATNIKDAGRRLRSNMEYKENMWYVQIPPINLQQKNESAWNNGVPPILTLNLPTLDNVSVSAEVDDLFPKKLTDLGYELYEDLNGNYCGGVDETLWLYAKQIKLKDRYMKVRIRYSGKKLAIIQSVLTLFRVSYA